MDRELRLNSGLTRCKLSPSLPLTVVTTTVSSTLVFGVVEDRRRRGGIGSQGMSFRDESDLERRGWVVTRGMDSPADWWDLLHDWWGTVSLWDRVIGRNRRKILFPVVSQRYLPVPP